LVSEVRPFELQSVNITPGREDFEPLSNAHLLHASAVVNVECGGKTPLLDATTCRRVRKRGPVRSLQTRRNLSARPLSICGWTLRFGCGVAALSPASASFASPFLRAFAKDTGAFFYEIRLDAGGRFGPFFSLISSRV